MNFYDGLPHPHQTEMISLAKKNNEELRRVSNIERAEVLKAMYKSGKLNRKQFYTALGAK